MKYIIATALIGLLSSAATAQNGFYFAPSAGIGISNSGINSNASGNGVDGQYKPVFSYNIQAGIGYHYKNWRFQTGFQYVKSGFKSENLTFGSDFDRYVPSGITMPNSYKVGFSQIGIPLQVGYAIPLSKKLTLVPYVGILTAFTFSSNHTFSYDGKISDSDLPGGTTGEYGWFRGWGTAGVQLEYKLSNKVSLIGGPSFQYKLATTGTKGNSGFGNLHFNLGLSIGL